MYLVTVPWSKTKDVPDHHDTVDKLQTPVLAIETVAAQSRNFG
jgi:hypothetical protein